jgi:hypothetical protein
MNQPTYLKVPFVWDEPQPPIEVSSRLTFEPVKARGENLLISVMASIMARSADASDRKKVSEYGSHAAAENFLSSTQGYSHEDEWWNKKSDRSFYTYQKQRL